MGQAKRRRQLLGEEYGTPPVFLLKIFGSQSHELILEIPFTVYRLQTAKQTNIRATANAIKIIAYLQESSEINGKLLAESLGEESLNAIAQVLPMPKQFWARLECEDGTQFHFQTQDGESIPADEPYQGKFERHWASDRDVRKLSTGTQRYRRVA